MEYSMDWELVADDFEDVRDFLASEEEDGDEYETSKVSGASIEDWAEDCPLDGDAESALASCGWGCDEDYGYYPDDPYEGDW